MWLTQAQARGKWCVYSPSPDKAACRASGCMQWRWAVTGKPIVIHAEPPTRKHEPRQRPEYVPASYVWHGYTSADDLARWVEPAADTETRRYGYCGLSGVPFEPYGAI